VTFVPARGHDLCVMAQLPPDLEALGEALTRATANAAALRRHRMAIRRRFAACVLAGLAVFAVMAPSPLGSAVHTQVAEQLAAAPAYGITYRCDRPHRNSGYLPPSCEVAEMAQPQAARQ
jgi:hypothetical protein